MLSSVCTGCGFWNELSTSWLFWRTDFYMATHHATLVCWSVSTICQDDNHSALPTPTASWYRKWNCQHGRQPSFCGCGSRHLKQTAIWCRRYKFTVNFSSTVKTFLANVNSGSPVRLSSVCLSVVCNARAAYSGGCNFPQFFYGIWYPAIHWHPQKILRRSS